MNNMGRYIEQLTPIILSVIAMYLYWRFDPIWMDMKEIIKEFPTIGTFTFGFLLTLFGLIHQGSNSVISSFKNRKRLYKRFVHFNRNTVFISLVLTIYAYVLANLTIWDGGSITGIHVIVTLFVGGFIYFTLTSIYFLYLFYLLVERDS